MPTNGFSSNSLSIQSPYTSAVAVTPSDTVDLTRTPRAIQAHKNGGHTHVTINVIMMNDTVAVPLVIPNGGPVPLRVKRVLVTGTDATSVVALY